jgi:hypothetical protein
VWSGDKCMAKVFPCKCDERCVACLFGTVMIGLALFASIAIPACLGRFLIANPAPSFPQSATITIIASATIIAILCVIGNPSTVVKFNTTFLRTFTFFNVTFILGMNIAIYVIASKLLGEVDILPIGNAARLQTAITIGHVRHVAAWFTIPFVGSALMLLVWGMVVVQEIGIHSFYPWLQQKPVS